MKIIAFCVGDSNDIKTWSNVPYFFLKQVDEEHDELIRINAQPFKSHVFNRIIPGIYNRIFPRFLGPCATFNNTWFYNHKKSKIVRNALNKNRDADWAIAFDFGTDLTNNFGTKTVMLSDWTVQYHLQHHLKKEPTKTESRIIKKQNKIIEHTDLAITLFPGVFEENKNRLSTLRYFGFPVNNSIEHINFDKRNWCSNEVLFVGKKKYKEALNTLIKAVELYNSCSDKKILVNVIGMSDEKNSDSVKYWGYLDKSNQYDQKLYNQLFLNSKIFINTTPNWVGASSLNEALSYGIPAIINPNLETKKLYNNEPFIYNSTNTPVDILACIKVIMNLDVAVYKKICKKASDFTSDNTWENYYRRIYQIINCKL